MTLSNTEDEYGYIAKIFHWTIAVLIIGLLPVGLFMGGMENSPLKFQIFAMHKSFGLLVFFLGIARLVWRFISPPPDHLESHARWEVTLAGAAHFWLYVCIIGMPLSGWLMSNAGEFPVPFFGIQMPTLVGKNESLGDLFYEVHEALGFTLLFVLALHAAGALKHHVIDKDETLARMTYKTKGLVLPVLIVAILGLSYAASGAAMLFGEDDEEEAAVATEKPGIPASAENAMPAADTSILPKDGWKIVPTQSKLQFQAVLYGSPFTGEFQEFSGIIIFNPDDLANAKADIRIDMKKVVTGDADRDKNIVGAEWFDSDKFPESRFVSKSFEKGGENNYVAIGDLTIHGVTMPLALPFTLDINGKTAHMKALATLNRINFGVGMGEWEDGKTVGTDVKIAIDLTAIQ